MKVETDINCAVDNVSDSRLYNCSYVAVFFMYHHGVVN